mgnify:CR=1 FL=1
MKKKILATLLAGVMVLSLAACGSNESKKDGSDTAKSDEGATHIYVLTAAEDHGWTGSVATFAKEKVEEVNKDVLSEMSQEEQSELKKALRILGGLEDE